MQQKVWNRLRGAIGSYLCYEMRYMLFLIAALAVGCSAQETPELEVIDATLLEMVGTHYYNEPLPLPPFRPIHPDSVEKEIFEDTELTIELDGEIYPAEDSSGLSRDPRHEYDSALNQFNNFNWEQYKRDSIEWTKLRGNRKKDKRNIVLWVVDSLVAPQLELTNRLSKKGFENNIQLEDSWRQLLVKLVDIDSNSKYLTLDKLTKVGEYLIRPVSFEPTERDRVAASLVFSRVVFNEDQTRACYYLRVLRK